MPCTFYPRCHFVQRGSTLCFVVVVVVVVIVVEALVHDSNKDVLGGNLIRTRL
jgi:uncharacterized membrane protein